MLSACASADLYQSAMKRPSKTRCHTPGGRTVIETVKGVWGSHPISFFVPDYFSVMACLYIFYFLSVLSSILDMQLIRQGARTFFLVRPCPPIAYLQWQAEKFGLKNKSYLECEQSVACDCVTSRSRTKAVKSLHISFATLCFMFLPFFKLRGVLRDFGRTRGPFRYLVVYSTSCSFSL